MDKKIKKGFTLVELVIVVAIIGILISISVPKFKRASQEANNKKIEANARILASDVLVFYSKHNRYPNINEQFDILNEHSNSSNGFNIFSANEKGVIILYKSDNVSKKIYTGNAPFLCDKDGNVLSQTDLDKIKLGNVKMVYFKF